MEERDEEKIRPGEYPPRRNGQPSVFAIYRTLINNYGTDFVTFEPVATVEKF